MERNTCTHTHTQAENHSRTCSCSHPPSVCLQAPARRAGCRQPSRLTQTWSRCRYSRLQSQGLMHVCTTSGRRGRRPAPTTNRAAGLSVAVVCVIREQLRRLRATQASCQLVTNPGLASRLAPGLKGRAFCMLWFRDFFFHFFLFCMLRREQLQHNPNSPTGPQKPQSSALGTRRKKYNTNGQIL